ncbi:PPOX class F420-dependent oxidoreductase [Antrihabitans spumae]|uniref:PPOX class F420-dependent oxidoreductase n=1 Tax=Antrihabitans spumae TaxID=3373370 RepID=A0ABW7K3A6_9NOCA
MTRPTKSPPRFDRAKLEEWVLRSYDWWRHPGSFEPGPAVAAGTLASLARHKYGLLITFRKNGEAVPSPMWFALHDGRAIIRTGLDSYKVKRILNNPDVVIAACTMRGKPIGQALAATARIMEPSENVAAEALLVSRYSLGRKIYDRTVAKVYADAAYIEVSPVSA